MLATNYARRFETRVLYSDMDALRHVNNGSTGRYLEEGRAELNVHVFGVDHIIDPPDGAQLLFVNVTVEYMRQAYYPGTAEIATAVSRIGTSSFTFVQAAFQNGECFALAEAVLVKARHGVSNPLTDAERKGLEAQGFAGAL